MPKENTTLALLIGLQEQEILDLRSRLRFSQDYTGLPMLFPALLLEIRVDQSQRRLSNLISKSAMSKKGQGYKPSGTPRIRKTPPQLNELVSVPVDTSILFTSPRS